MRYNDRALALRPNDDKLLRRRAGLDVWAGNLERAADTLKALTAANLNDPDVKHDLEQFQERMLTYARVRAEQGDFDGALELLEHYRASGADEDAYLRERMQVQGIAVRTAPLRAAAEKRWGDRKSVV